MNAKIRKFTVIANFKVILHIFFVGGDICNPQKQIRNFCYPLMFLFTVNELKKSLFIRC